VTVVVKKQKEKQACTGCRHHKQIARQNENGYKKKKENAGAKESDIKQNA
jgi:hypothetical protein